MKIKMFIVALVMTVGVNAFTYLQVEAQEKEIKQEQKSITVMYKVQELLSDGFLYAPPINKDEDGAFIFENKYKIGDVVEVTFEYDGIDSEFTERKITGNELMKIEKSSTEKFMVKSVTDDGMLYSVSLEKKTNAPNGYILDNKYSIGDIVEVTYWNDDIFYERKISGKKSKEMKLKSVTELFEVVELREDGLLDAMPLGDSMAPNGYILDNKYSIGDIVEVTYWNDDIFAERRLSDVEKFELGKEARELIQRLKNKSVRVSK